MKYISFFLIVAFISLTTGLMAQRSLQNTIRKYKNNENVVSLNYKQEVNDYFDSKKKKFKTWIDAIDIIAFKDGSDVSPSDLSVIKENLNNEKYELLINAKQKDGKLELYTLGPDEEIKKIFAHVKKEKYNIYFTMTGKIVLDELPELGLEFQGSDIFSLLPNELGEKQNNK